MRPIKIIILFVLLSILSFTSSVYSTDIASILQKSVGGEKAVETIKSLESIYMSGDIDMNGTIGTFEYKFRFPQRYLLTLTFQNFSIIQGYDGSVAWQKDISGQKTELTGPEKKAILQTVYLNSFSFLFDDSLKNKKSLGRSYLGGNVYEQLIFFPFDNDTLNIYFDAITGYRKITKSKQDFFETVSYDSLYRKINNINVPFYSKSVVQQMNFSFSQSVDTIIFDKTFPDSIFLFQKRSDSNYRFPATEKITLNFEFHNNHIFLPVTISGTKKVHMLLDSGAGASIIKTSTVNELHFDTVGTIPAVGVSGSEETKLYRTDSLRIGELKLYNQRVGSLQLQNIMKNKINKVEFGGILGNDFLSQFPVLVDYQNKELTIFNPKHYKAPKGGNSINFEYYMLIPTIEAKVASQKCKLIIDLGNAFGLILHPHFIQSQNIEQKLKDKVEINQLMGGIGGAVKGFQAVVDSVQLGNQILIDEKVSLPQSSQGLSGSKEIGGNIGNALLKRYKVLLDYPNNMIILFDY